MFTIVPLIPFVLIFLSFYIKLNEDDALPSWRLSFLSTSIVWGVILTAITEVLSIFNLLKFAWLLGLWSIGSLISAFIFLIVIYKAKVSVSFKVPNVTNFQILLLIAVGFIIATLGMIALVAPPNNWDSMTYHMSRVVHWIQNQSVAFYPTNILRQNYNSPWAEFAIMHFQILSGGDRFANLIQWFSMVGSVIGVSLIAEQLGAKLRGQILAAVVTATIPMGILQATSTQNDYAVSFWLVCFVYYIMLLAAKERTNCAFLLGAGCSLGLAILTKATAYIFACPFLVWFVLSRVKILKWQSWKPIIIVAVISLSINMGHYGRNFDLFGHPLGPGKKSSSGAITAKYSNEIFTVSSLVSNVVRNIGLHIGTPFYRVNAFLEKGINQIHNLLDVDINDSRTTWSGREFKIYRLSNNEDYAGNLLHFALIIPCLAIFLLTRLRESRNLAIYSLSVMASFLLFCFYLKWTPWYSRNHLPLFILLSPFIAIVLLSTLNDKITNSIALVLVSFASLWIFYNNTRPIVGNSDTFNTIFITNSDIFNTSRIDQYFSRRPELRDPYVAAARFLRSQECRNIGLSLRNTDWEIIDDWEYPFWVLLKENNNERIRFEHINVENVSAIRSKMHRFNGFTPCAIISLGSAQGTEIVTEEGAVYMKKWSLSPVNVFIRQ